MTRQLSGVVLAGVMAVMVAVNVQAQMPEMPQMSVAPQGPLVSTEWVHAQLHDPSLVVLHVGPQATYDAGHVPGARLVTAQMISVTGKSTEGGTLNLQMLEPAALHTALQNLGITDTSRIVVYAATTPVMTTATRVVLTMQYAGLGERTSLMQGGLASWRAENRPLSAEVPIVTAGGLSPLTVVPLVVDGDAVEALRKSPGVRIVDARADALYKGEQTGGGRDTPHKTGHIEGAVNVPFNSTYDQQGRFKSVEELQSLFTAAGVQPGDTVVAYCHIGQQASATIFAARLLGFDVRLYDGSFEDWSRRPNAAVTNPAVKK
jgi:thiosulfate/3-mercaptopyruvate sulfurtransferase